LLIMIGTSYLQTAMMMNRNPAASQNPQMKYMKYLPLVFGIICIHFPAGVVLYYAVSNVCRITQQFAMYRWDPKVRALVSDEVRDVEARTRDIDRAEGYTPDYDDYDDDQGPAVRPRTSFRELLAQTRNPTPPADADPPRGNGKGGPSKTNPSSDRPGSVKANRNRNGAGSSAPRPTRPGTGGSVKRARPGTNGANGNGSSNGTKGNGSSTGKTNGSASRSTNGSSNGASRNGNNGKPAPSKDPKAGGKTNGSPSASNGNGSGRPRSGTGSGAGGRSGSGAAGGPSSPRNRRRRGR
jgi:uncharacterized membrane protein YgcG